MKSKHLPLEDFKIVKPIDISTIKTFEDFGLSEKKLNKSLRKTRIKLGKLQDKLYAHGKYSVLVCFKVWIPQERIV